ncbi:MAG: hypothetical protein EVB11_01535 [Winogradskyella sp.]|nr:MAG: hypothetical protein EVB11_01535 [Winogradskyella sp.]
MRNFILFIIPLLFFCCDKNSLQDDISKIARLHDKAYNTVSDSALIYIKDAKILIENNSKLPDTLRIENIFKKGYYYLQTNKLDSASYYFHRTIDLIKGANNRERNRVYFQNTWETDEKLDNYKNAISAAQKLIDISNPIDNNSDLLYAFNYLERVYLELGDFEKSLNYNTLVSNAAIDTKNIDMYVITASSKAITKYYYSKKVEAFKLLDSLKLIECGLDAKRQLLRAYGILNYREEEYIKAIKYYKLVINLSKEIELEDYNYNMLESYNNISEAYIEAENYPIAKKYLDSTKSIIKPDSDSEYVLFYNELRFRYNYRTKNNEDELLDEYLDLLDENNKQHQQKINEELIALTLSNEKEQLAILQKNKAEIDKLKLLVLTSVLGLLIFIGYLLYRQRRFKFEREGLRMQQRLLRSQMNPHFMFNTLSVIQNQIKESKEHASNYLLKFSRLLRLILENSLNDYVQIENELESVRKYLDLQLVRFPDKFSYNIILENFEEEDLLFIPPMLIQPFVENSIEHGFIGINYKGVINIKLSLQDKWISCVIEDNGIGLKAPDSKLKGSVSVDLISKFILKTTKQKISITDRETESHNTSGVLVNFLIPYKFSEHD